MNRRYWMAGVGALSITSIISEALAKGDVPPGIAKLDGSATVNGRDAKVGTPVNLGDRVATARGSQAVVVVGSDAFLLRSNTIIEVQGSQGILSSMLVATGQVLSVFSKKPVAIKPVASWVSTSTTGRSADTW